MTDHNCGIGILSIFDTVFWYLPNFLAVVRYWVTPNVPLFKGLDPGELPLLELVPFLGGGN